MKTVVLANDLATTDVINGEVYQTYTELLEKNIQTDLLKSSLLVEVACPGCGRLVNSDAYDRMGLMFKQCADCGSYYVSPRPNQALQEDFNRDSEACRYWRSQIAETSDEKRYYLYGPRVNWISELVDEFISDPSLLLDFETKHPFFLKHVEDEKLFKRIGVLQPQVFEQATNLPKDILQGDDINKHEGAVSVFTAFDVVERMFDPKDVFSAASRFCQPGGLLLLTTASCTGFEYQVLGKHAPNINPVNRMNLISSEALINQVKAAGFEILEFSTPGRLDVEIVRQAIENAQAGDIDPFWKYIFNFRDEKTWDGLQNFLQENRLSSHVRIAARKK